MFSLHLFIEYIIYNSIFNIHINYAYFYCSNLMIWLFIIVPEIQICSEYQY